MTITLHRSWTEALAGSPETGMGYQVLELRGLSLRPEHVIVANGVEAVEPARGRFVVHEGIEKATADRIAKALEGPVQGASFAVLTRPQAIVAKVLESRSRVGSGPANEAPVGVSAADERFLRFSAYANDIRILTDGSVTPGTYVTTFADGMLHVKTGMDAVRRYALPNPAPAVRRYHLKPPRPIQVQRGTAQPAFGQPGGGAEVIFPDGSPAGTKLMQDQIPPR